MISRLASSALLGALALASFITTGCGSAKPVTEEYEDEEESDAGSSSRDAGPSRDPFDGAVTPFVLLPETIYSGVDGTHAFQVPVAVHGAKGATITASDPSAVTVEPAKIMDPNSGEDGEIFLVTMKKAGAFTLTARAGSQTTTSSLTVTNYAAARYADGERRYMNQATSGPACVSCHASQGGVDHSPTALSAASDSDVSTVIKTGVLVSGNAILQVKHKWAVTDAERDGLITYLRALPPRGYAKK